VKDLTAQTLATEKARSYSAAPEGKPMAKHTGIRKLPNGRFRGRFFAGYDSQGRRRYPARTFDTQREAIDWRAEQVASRGPGSVDGCGVLLATYLDHWLASKHELRENSRRMYQSTIDSYIKPGLGRVKLTRLSANQIEHWQTELLKRVGKSTTSTARTILYGACKKAVRMKLIRSNPVEGTDGPGRGKPYRYQLSVEEALAIVEAGAGSRFGVMFEMAVICGLRPEELIALRWQDLELNAARGVVRVRRVVHHLKGGGWTWQEPKTISSNRTIVFPGDLAAKLSDHRKQQLQHQLKAGQYWKGNDLIFPTRTGEPVRYCVIHTHFKRIVARAKLSPEINLYSLRHFFVTSSLLAGVDAKTVSGEAGHSKVSFTLERYGSVLEEMHQSASDKREALLRSRKKG
jgi:integrase